MAVIFLVLSTVYLWGLEQYLLQGGVLVRQWRNEYKEGDQSDNQNSDKVYALCKAWVANLNKQKP